MKSAGALLSRRLRDNDKHASVLSIREQAPELIRAVRHAVKQDYQRWRDAWFVGFTPEVTTAIWFGYDTQGISLGVGQTGGGIAAPTWGRYMRQALSRYPVTGFPEFAGLESLKFRLGGMKPTAETARKL